jgi:hypothetical protein
MRSPAPRILFRLSNIPPEQRSAQATTGGESIVPTLTETNPTIAHKLPDALPDTYAAELGPYEKSYDCRVTGYVTHSGGGDDSTAMMRLLYDGGPVGEAFDHSFNIAKLEVPYAFRLSRGSSVGIAMVTENHIATVADHGFRLSWTEVTDEFAQLWA